MPKEPPARTRVRPRPDPTPKPENKPTPRSLPKRAAATPTPAPVLKPSDLANDPMASGQAIPVYGRPGEQAYQIGPQAKDFAQNLAFGAVLSHLIPWANAVPIEGKAELLEREMIEKGLNAVYDPLDEWARHKAAKALDAALADPAKYSVGQATGYLERILAPRLRGWWDTAADRAGQYAPMGQEALRRQLALAHLYATRFTPAKLLGDFLGTPAALAAFSSTNRPVQSPDFRPVPTPAPTPKKGAK